MARAEILILVIALVAAGCATDFLKKKDQGPVAAEGDAEVPLLPEPGLRMATAQRFEDVPIPQDAKEDLERTYVYESSTLQMGRMVYTTRGTLNELAEFYIRECPEHEWKLGSVLQAEGYEMTFAKPGKRLVVAIREMGIARGRLLVLNLTPQDGTGTASVR